MDRQQSLSLCLLIVLIGGLILSIWGGIARGAGLSLGAITGLFLLWFGVMICIGFLCGEKFMLAVADVYVDAWYAIMSVTRLEFSLWCLLVSSIAWVIGKLLERS